MQERLHRLLKRQRPLDGSDDECSVADDAEKWGTTGAVSAEAASAFESFRAWRNARARPRQHAKRCVKRRQEREQRRSAP